jgi:hypothetical protein
MMGLTILMLISTQGLLQWPLRLSLAVIASGLIFGGFIAQFISAFIRYQVYARRTIDVVLNRGTVIR